MSQASRLKNHGHVQPLTKKENARAAENAGIKKFKLLYMANTKMHVFKHPKYYTELRKRNKSDQAISKEPATAGNQRSPGPGLKQRDSQVVNQVELSSQSQASSSKRQANRGASSNKRLMLDQSSSAKQGVSRTSVIRPRIDVLP